MRFVDHCQIDRHHSALLSEFVTKPLPLKTLRGHEHEIRVSDISGAGRLLRHAGGTGDAMTGQRLDLVVDERDQRIYDQRSARGAQPRQLVDEALAGTGRQQHHAITPGQRLSDRLYLACAGFGYREQAPHQRPNRCVGVAMAGERLEALWCLLHQIGGRHRQPGRPDQHQRCPAVVVGQFRRCAVARLKPHIHIHRLGRRAGPGWFVGRPLAVRCPAPDDAAVLAVQPDLRGHDTAVAPQHVQRVEHLQVRAQQPRCGAGGVIDPDIPPVAAEPACADRFAHGEHQTMRLHRRPHQTPMSSAFRRRRCFQMLLQSVQACPRCGERLRRRYPYRRQPGRAHQLVPSGVDSVLLSVLSAVNLDYRRCGSWASEQEVAATALTVVVGRHVVSPGRCGEHVKGRLRRQPSHAPRMMLLQPLDQGPLSGRIH